MTGGEFLLNVNDVMFKKVADFFNKSYAFGGFRN